MINVCKKDGEQFMWKGVFNDGTIKEEFDEAGNENDIIAEIMGKSDLKEFGLAGNGFFSFFNTDNGIFNLFGDNVELCLEIDGVNIMGCNEIRNKVIMFRSAESILHPSGGQTDGNVFKYSFGYKLENDHCYIRAITSIDMYEGIKIELGITGKDNIESNLKLMINGNIALDKEIKLIKDTRQEIVIPMQNK